MRSGAAGSRRWRSFLCDESQRNKPTYRRPLNLKGLNAPRFLPAVVIPRSRITRSRSSLKLTRSLPQGEGSGIYRPAQPFPEGRQCFICSKGTEVVKEIDNDDRQ